MTFFSSLAWTGISFVLFTALVAIISAWKTRDEQLDTAEGYFLAGRGLPGVVIAGSLLLTNLSAEQLVGLNGQSWKTNMGPIAWEVGSMFTLLVLAYYFLPKYLKMGAMTIPSLMEERYGRGTKTMFSVVIVVMYSILNLPVILYSGAVVFEQIFDISGIMGTSKFVAVAILCVIIGIIGGCYAIFGGLKAVDDFNLMIGRTEIAGLIGPNGAGKTTVFNLLTKVYQPTRGTVLLDGVDTHNMNTVQVNKAGIARTFQNIRLWKSQTVFENVLIAKHCRRSANLLSATFRLNADEEKRQREECENLLHVLGLEDVRNELATGLPYGLQRRVEIARALATEPKLLLLDEPAAGMNPQETEELTAFIGEIREKFGSTIFLIEHHMNLVMDISDRIYVLDFGKLIAHGTPAEIQKNQRVIDAYLGVADDA